MPTDGSWCQWQCLKKRWNRWAAPSGGDVLAAAATGVATDILVATNTGDPGPLDIKEKIPGDFPLQGTQSQSRGPQATFCCRDTVWGWAQAFSPSQQRWQVIFAKRRAPSPPKKSLECDARIDKALWLLPPTWQAERVLEDGANWSRPEEGEGEEDLECPPLLEAHLQELLGGEESFLAVAEVRDGFPPASMPNDLEPSPLHQSDQIQWHTHQVEMPAWWRELLEVSGHDNCWEFAQKVHTSFEVPKACNWAKGDG